MNEDIKYWVGFSSIPGIGRVRLTQLENYFGSLNSSWPAHDLYNASLLNWANLDVKLRFQLSGDIFFPNGSWWIDDVAVTDVQIPGACTTVGAGPPPIPDGASVPGAPMVAARSGDDVSITWDVVQCPSTEVNIYHGAIGGFSTFAGGACALPASGSATVAIPADSWFLVVGTDGASTDGSWSRDPAGNELSYSGSTTACPAITAHTPRATCP